MGIQSLELNPGKDTILGLFMLGNSFVIGVSVSRYNNTIEVGLII